MAKKYIIKDMQIVAAERGGKCISTVYKNIDTRLEWKCDKGHPSFKATPYKVKDRHQWCPVCGGKQKLTIGEMHRIAKERGGKCLSKKYINNRTKLLWECSDKHKWEAIPSNIKKGRWCPKCAGKIKPTMTEINEVAKKRGGKCLSNKYLNSNSKLLWECAEGHQWKAIFYNIISGTWCPKCSVYKRTEKLRADISEFKNIAKVRGGNCLSLQHINSSTKLLWECSEGHKWKAVPSSIKFGTWCPKCSASLGERICREFFEQIFNQSFPTERPEWLINRKGNRMHLDGYCPQLKIAFEHHGLQHYSLNPPFVITDKILLKRKNDDNLKKKLCRKYRVKLIEIPEIPSLLPIKKVKSFLKTQFLKHDIKIPSNYDKLEIDYSRAYVTPISRRQWDNLVQIIQDKGGKCLSNTYINAKEKILVECKNGHQWWAFPDNLKKGTWCKFCVMKEINKLRRTGINKMQEVAKKRGGKCLSEYYVNSDNKLTWECSEGHQWEANAKGIKYKGAWCPICGGSSKLSIEEMQEIAVIRGGKCLSKSYVNNKTNLLWECKEGHHWEATPHNVKTGQWCPVCYGNKRKQIKSEK